MQRQFCRRHPWRLLFVAAAAVMLCTSVGCVSWRHRIQQYCWVGMPAPHDNQDAYYHSPHSGQIIPKEGFTACGQCQQVPSYHGYEATCWRQWPEGWGCPPQSLMNHPEFWEGGMVESDQLPPPVPAAQEDAERDDSADDDDDDDDDEDDDEDEDPDRDDDGDPETAGSDDESDEGEPDALNLDDAPDELDARSPRSSSDLQIVPTPDGEVDESEFSLDQAQSSPRSNELEVAQHDPPTPPAKSNDAPAVSVSVAKLSPQVSTIAKPASARLTAPRSLDAPTNGEDAELPEEVTNTPTEELPPSLEVSAPPSFQRVSRVPVPTEVEWLQQEVREIGTVARGQSGPNNGNVQSGSKSVLESSQAAEPQRAEPDGAELVRPAPSVLDARGPKERFDPLGRVPAPVNRIKPPQPVKPTSDVSSTGRPAPVNRIPLTVSEG